MANGTKRNGTKNGKSTALATIPMKNFAICKQDSDRWEILQANLEGETIDIASLDRITIPSGETNQWCVPNADGEKDMVKAIEGVVVAKRSTRAYWPQSIEESQGQTPPQCVSNDSKTGVGDPGGECERGRTGICPFAQWGSAAKGDGQACKKRLQLLVVRAKDLLPIVINLPATSLKVGATYFMGLPERYWHMVTRFELEPATNKGGIKYVRAKLLRARILDDEARKKFDDEHKGYSELLGIATVTEKDYADEATEDAAS